MRFIAMVGIREVFAPSYSAWVGLGRVQIPACDSGRM